MAQTTTYDSFESKLIFGTTVPAVNGNEEDNDTLFITPSGDATTAPTEMWKFDAETNQWIQVPTSTTCPAPMTRNALIALRNAGNLDTQCHYVITNPNAQGNLDLEAVILHAVDESTISHQAGLKTSHDNTAWQGSYDIDTDDVLEVVDNIANKVTSNPSIIAFPFGVASVNENIVHSGAIVNYTAGNFQRNTISADANVTHNTGNFNENTVANDATVISSGNVLQNHFKANSNTTVNSGDFIENEVQGDATVVSNTTGDVDNNTFRANSNTTINAGNFDMNEVHSDANVISSGGSVSRNHLKSASNTTINGGNFYDNTVGENADVVIESGSNFENEFGTSTSYRQVGTGYIRYSKIGGTTAWVNGNTNVSNVTSHVSTVNTTGSAGTIYNSIFVRAYMQNLQNIPSLTVIDSSITNYATVQTNGSARIYIYRSTVTDGSRILCSAGSRIDMSYTNVSAYGYIQSTIAGGILTVNYTDISGIGYVRNLTPNTHRVERCSVTSNGNIRFDGDATGGRVYYSSADSNGSIYQTTGSVNCYIYYAKAHSVGQVYTQNSVNARLYYSAAGSYSYVRSLNNTTTHYMYYCNADARGYVQMNNNTAQMRMYAVSAKAQSIVELRNSTANGNLYYSDFSAYFYAYVTRNGGTSSGLFGQGRRTQTVTNPTTVAPFAAGTAWLNFN